LLNSSPNRSATGAILRRSATAAACTELSWKVDTLSDCIVMGFHAGLALVAVIFLHGQSSIGAVLSLSQTSP